MLDKQSLKLLKEFKKNLYLERRDILKITGCVDEKFDPYLERLLSVSFLEKNEYYNRYFITMDGLAFLQNRKENFLRFVIPYSITTLIAIASLVVSFIR